MTGTKATALDRWAAGSGSACLRFDYFAHGRSTGDFLDATVGRWLDDSLAVLAELTEGPQILVGSSMGAWLALLLARARPARIAALVLIAPAPDFTEALLFPRLPEALRRTLAETGRCLVPSAYGSEPYLISRRLIEEGRRHLILDQGLDLAGPVRILQGMRDEDVPWHHALRVVEAVRSPDVMLTLTKSGDHRLSTPSDLVRLTATIEDLYGTLGAARSPSMSAASPSR